MVVVAADTKVVKHNILILRFLNLYLTPQKWLDLVEKAPSSTTGKYNAPVGLSNHTVDVVNKGLLRYFELRMAYVIVWMVI